MRRIAGLALLLLAACGTDGDMSAGDTSTSSPAETTPVAASCAPSVESPFNGISAVTDDGDVAKRLRRCGLSDAATGGDRPGHYLATPERVGVGAGAGFTGTGTVPTTWWMAKQEPT